MQVFDMENKEHRLICLAAIAAADALGQGRITAAKEQLELNDIRAYRTSSEQDKFQNAILSWGRDIK